MVYNMSPKCELNQEYRFNVIVSSHTLTYSLTDLLAYPLTHCLTETQTSRINKSQINLIKYITLLKNECYNADLNQI